MMTEDSKIAELVAYLDSLGFKGEKLENDLISQLTKPLKSFSVEHRIEFGDDLMRYGLGFEYEPQFKSFKLTWYEAIFRSPVSIDHRTIGGMDTGQLEKRMASIDWEKFFENAWEGSEEMDGRTNQVLNDLWQLAEGDDLDGEEIQNQLMFKYWPEEHWDDSTAGYKMVYERSRIFKATAEGFCHADLAYHIVSGHLDKIQELVTRSRIDRFPGLDITAALSRHLSENPDRFALQCSADLGEGLLDLSIPIQRTAEGGYHADSIDAVFTYYPEIRHGNIAGIDTAALEDRMVGINWRRDWSYFDKGNDIRGLSDPIAEIDELLYRIAKDGSDGREIAAYLQMKYWSPSPSMREFVTHSAWHISGNWRRYGCSFPIDFNTGSIANAMLGRPAMPGLPAELPDGYNEWVVVDPRLLDEKPRRGFETIHGLTGGDVLTLVNTLPLGDAISIEAIYQLLQGDRLRVTVNGIEGPREVLLEANPRSRTLDIYTLNLKPIAFNFGMDPDWTPPGAARRQTEGLKAKPPQKRMGKGI